MKNYELLQVIVFFTVLCSSAPLLGLYIARVFSDKNQFRFLEKIEKKFCRCAGIDQTREMHWTQYAASLLIFNAIGLIFVFLIQLFQNSLPLNPQHLKNVEPLLALNTAVSFVTNTNWQAYSGESTMSYLVQMAGLTVQNFLSAATGLAVMVAFARGIERKECGTIGNYWVDVFRSTLYILLPLSIVLATVLMSQGVVQTFSSYIHAHTLCGQEQIIPLGPVASQEAIKQLGTNGGGFFGANSAHPFENPTPLSNFIEMLAILLIPAAQVFAFGKLTNNKKHSVVLFTVMMFVLLCGFAVSWYSEVHSAEYLSTDSLLEGKEVRFGVMNSCLWETITTAASNGSVNAMHDSMSPLSILVAFVNILLGEVIFGGVGSGLYGMILFVMLTIFLAGLMVGRTPEYFGKKIENREICYTMTGILFPNLLILCGLTCALLNKNGLAGIQNSGPHGLSEILYAFASAAGNNGSALAGLASDTPFYNILLALTMIAGRFGIIIPVLAISGRMARKNSASECTGAFRSDNLTFAIVLLVSIMTVGALTFAPALMLGPVLEQMLLACGITF